MGSKGHAQSEGDRVRRSLLVYSAALWHDVARRIEPRATRPMRGTTSAVLSNGVEGNRNMYGNIRGAAMRRRSVRTIVAAGCLIAVGLFAGRHVDAKRPEELKGSSARRAVSLRASERALQHEWHLLDPCTPDECVFWDSSGTPYRPQPAVVATPAGTTYSISHGIFGDPDGPGPLAARCILISNPQLPGAPDDIVRYDGVPEAIRTDLFGTVPTINEAVVTNGDGTFQLVIDSFSPVGTDLFPDRFVDSTNGEPLRDICFTIGLDDPLNWAGADTVTAALFELRKSGSTIVGPLNITGITNPWNGFFSVVVEQAAGLEANQVHIEILISKDVPPPANDDCEDATPLSNGTTAISNVGASTDGFEEPELCDFDGSAQINSDIWYEYVATCNGDLTVDMCGSFFDTKLAVYDGCGVCPPGVGPVVCNDDDDGCGVFGEQSRVTVPVMQGQCYRVRVGGFLGEQGLGALRVSCFAGACCNTGACASGLTRPICEDGGGEWFPGATCDLGTCPPPTPPNDECADCESLTTDEVFAGTTNGAGGSKVTTCGGGGDTRDTWHCWMADCTGVATFDVCDSAYDTTLAIFDGCDGNELECNDDTCGLSGRRSRIDAAVVEGTTYYVRVSGFDGAVGDYNLLVTACQPPRGACCLANQNQQCFPSQTETTCLKFDGTYLGDGVTCLADQNGNGADDACETCMNVTIAQASPRSGTVDARAPHPVNDDTPNQGIGSPAEPVEIILSESVIGSEECFDLCETIIDAEKGPNAVLSVTDLGLGRYQIVLERAITPGGVTTIRHLGDGSFVEYVAHPGNVNADALADASDLNVLVDCCVLGQCTPTWGLYSCDLDHSGTWAPADILMAIDMLNGAGTLTPASGTQLPVNAGSCP